MLAVCKTLDTPNNSLTIGLSEEEECLDDHERDYYTDRIMRPKEVIYWPSFVSRRRRRRRRRLYSD